MGNPQTSRAAQLSLTDPKVCRSFLVGTCPHDLFTNTKKDVGPCPKVHAEPLKTEYESLSEPARQKLGFEHDYVRDLQKYIDECNRWIETAQRRLEKTPDEIRQTNVLLRSVSELNATVDDGLLEVRVLAGLGDVARACDDFFRVRQAAQAKAERERELKNLSDTGGPSGHQKLQVCDVCGAYLSRLDNDRRLADHFYGKMHLGYAQMRKTYEALARDRGRGAGGGGGGRLPPNMLDDGPRDDGDGWRGGGPRGPRRGGGGGGGGGGGYGGRNGRGFRGGW